MASRITPRKEIRIFLAEWREHFGLTQIQVGTEFDPPLDKASVSRYETAASGSRKDNRTMSVEGIAAYAEALSRASGRKIHASMLYRRPTDEESLDELIAGAPKRLRQIAREQVAALVKRGR